jgi:tetratricopeptide (TPR) repeat protein
VKTVQDFNYKVALASGLKQLQAGRLRQAEEQFRYLVSKFPKADGGYRGLARVQVELGDRAAALATLREGAAVLSKTGERAIAIALLREAVMLDPLDLSAHRRLAAGLALAGDISGAASEYVRFTQLELTAGDPDRAKLEAMYALETFGEIPALHEMARSLGLGKYTLTPGDTAPPGVPAARAFEPPASRPVIDERTALFGRAPAEPAVEPPAAAEAPADAWSAPAAATDTWAAPAVATDTWATPAAEPAGAEPAPIDERAALLAAAMRPSLEAAPPPPPPPSADAFELEERAALLIASKDPGAGAAAIEAASALLDAGKTHAASDLLLALVASGTAVHDAALELIAVASALGRREIATERAALLSRVLQLAGEEERAAQVERIGQTL